MAAVAYIRRSASEESPVSEEAQRETVVRLAAGNGDAIARVFRDWGRSGSDKGRPQYLAMLAECEAGRVDTIYAYHQDRLARDNLIFATLLDSADRHGFRVVTPSGDLTDDERRTFAEMGGVMDGAELRKMRKRAKAIDAMQRERGDARGMAPYGYAFRTPGKDRTERVVHEKVDPDAIAHVIAAYKAAGTFLGAARALNAEGWPSKHGRAWHATTVKGIILREAPHLAADVRQGTRKERRPRLLSQLLRCYCGGPMSPTTGGGAPGWYCGRAQRGLHGRPSYISESRLLPWIIEEAARLRAPSEVSVDGGAYDDSADRAALEALRGRIADSVIEAGLADLDAKRAAHGERQRVVEDVPQAIDWDSDPPEAVNEVLCALWHHVQLGPDLLPVEADWKVPQWRA